MLCNKQSSFFQRARRPRNFDCGNKEKESPYHVARQLDFLEDNVTAVSMDLSVLVKSNHQVARSSFQSKASLVAKDKDKIPELEAPRRNKNATASILSPNALSKTTMHLIEAFQIKKEKIQDNENEMKSMHVSERSSSKKPRKK